MTAYIHDLFQLRVGENFNQIAIVLDNKRLTYLELNRQANQLARYLRKLGVGPEVVVGLCMERSRAMIVALLGILKAGGAYLPLDPIYPKERLAFMIQDARASIVLTGTQYLKKLPQCNAKIVCLDADGENIARESQENLVNLVKIKNLAYVIYTSGSTGKPKGVAIAHESLANFVKVASSEYGLQPSDRVLQFASISFDAAVEEIFPCLVNGATLVLRTNDMLSSIPKFLQKCRDFEITVLDLPTAFWHQLCLELDKERLALPHSIRLVIIGGERARPQQLEIWKKQVNPQVRLVNTYGPTETTVVTTMCDLAGPKAIATSGRVLPIGRAIENSQTYILDPLLKPVPQGETGELYIAGINVARGYLNQPELTTDKFIPNPFSQDRSDRLYKTGDLVRSRPDGNLEFLNRIDNQVKIRGFRIELEEIEAVLNQHPYVGESIIIAREDISGDKRLVAYVVPRQKNGKGNLQLPEKNIASCPWSDHANNPQQEIFNSNLVVELQSYLRGKLPAYMVPSHFILLETLPLTLNGKVDRRALPAPASFKPEMSATNVAPRTFIEEVLASIWCEVLHLKQVSINDNFFDLGGHSLFVAQLFTRVERTFQIELSLMDLWRSPTVSGLAETIEKMLRVEEDSNTIDLKTNWDLNAEATLDPTIGQEINDLESKNEPNKILLTGATGFLGTFLLHELLLQTQADIYCLVRASSVEEGKKRLQNSLETASLWDESQRSRIIPVLGDLSQPLLGLSHEQFQILAEKLDVIYHNGALVNSTYPYSTLKATNVLGTQEVLRLASQAKVKPVHFISTLDVFPLSKSEYLKVIYEGDNLDCGQELGSGYAQSKWVAEKLAPIARSRGIPVSIYRPGRISGDSKTGFSNSDDLIFRLIKGCIQLGSAPVLDMALDLTPVDYVSKAIVYLSRQPKSLNKEFHLITPQPIEWNKLFNWVGSFGYPLQQISLDKWQEELRRVTVHSLTDALHPLVSLFSKKEIEGQKWNPQLLQFDCQNTLAQLAGTSITCPIIDFDLFCTYLFYSIHIEWLDAPKQGAKDIFNQKYLSLLQKN